MNSTKRRTPESLVRAIYRKLARAWGAQHWWPGDTCLEVIAGAILTQNTSWTNVERALANLRSAGILTVRGIREVNLERLQELIRPSGYYRQKAERLKNFIAFVDVTYQGSLEQMLAAPTFQLRSELLALNGIGPETADSILLYAGNHEIFVVDAYTRRVLERHQAVQAAAKYDEIRELAQRALKNQKTPMALPDLTGNSQSPPAHAPSRMSRAARSPLAQAYNDMHGLFVQVGKHYCHKQEPKCEACPLQSLLPKA